MILKGNQRGGGRQMALHLLNGEQNEHVRVHEVRGFVAEDVLGALNEAYALSKGTRCRQFMYSLSLNPPQDEQVGIETFEEALERIEKKLGLTDQPRVLVFHEKEGRRHAHCVWSRIDTEEMKAINISHPKLKLNDISKSLYLEMGWKLPEGFIDKSRKNPLNFTREEWQQAKRIGRKAADIKRELQECWAVSDNKKSFMQALDQCGYALAKGDKRGFVAVDIHGEVYSLTRQLGRKAKELQSRLGDPARLPSVDKAKETIKGKITKLFKRYSDELNAQHKEQASPLIKAKDKMVKQHRSEREKLETAQKTRWQEEENKRAAKVRKGFKGIWDKLNGRYWKTRKQNERESWACFLRDKNEREELTQKQLQERQGLQQRINALHEDQEHERKALIRDLDYISKHNRKVKKRDLERSKTREKQRQNDFGLDDSDQDMEPEI